MFHHYATVEAKVSDLKNLEQEAKVIKGNKVERILTIVVATSPV
jgi:hypothetical protein